MSLHKDFQEDSEQSTAEVKYQPIAIISIDCRFPGGADSSAVSNRIGYLRGIAGSSGTATVSSGSWTNNRSFGDRSV